MFSQAFPENFLNLNSAIKQIARENFTTTQPFSSVVHCSSVMKWLRLLGVTAVWWVLVLGSLALCGFPQDVLWAQGWKLLPAFIVVSVGVGYYQHHQGYQQGLVDRAEMDRNSPTA